MPPSTVRDTRALVAAACATKELYELPSLFVYVIMIAADAALPWRHLALLRHANVNMKSFCPLFMTPSTQGQDMLLTFDFKIFDAQMCVVS